MGGYIQGRNTQVLSNYEWTKKVTELAKIIGYELTLDDSDRELHPGHYCACYAEK
jgi:hypothetical protein